MVVLTVAVALAAAGGAQAAFSGVAAVPTGRFDHTTTLLPDGRLLVAGGSSTNGQFENTVRLYNPKTNTWGDAGAMHTARSGQAAVLLGSDKVLVAGGVTTAANPFSPTGDYSASAEIYNLADNTWASAGSMSTARLDPTMTVLKDGRVLVAGGIGDVEDAQGQVVASAVPLASADIYNPKTGEWSPADAMSAARANATATALPGDKVLVAGGYDGNDELASAEVYDAATGHWSKTAKPLKHARDSATATTLPDGQVLVAGGDGGPTVGALASAEIYNPDTDAWHDAAPMADARRSAAAARLTDGAVLVTGGMDTQGTALTSTERYDPVDDAWTDAGAMATARASHTLTALDDGRALVVGGNDGGHDVGFASVERYSPVSTTVTVGTFGSHPVGTPSDVVDAVITNTNTTDSTSLVVSGISLAGHSDFAVAPGTDTCSLATVAPGASCHVGLVFTPKAGGQRSATLTLADNTASGTTTASLSGSGIAPAGADPGGSTPPANGSTGGSGQTGSASPAPRQEIKGAKSKSAARATCTVGNARSHGRTRSTVSCRMTWPTRSTVALNAKLMRGRTVVMSTRTTAKSGQAKITMRLSRRLSSGRYTVVISRRNGASVLRQDLRVR